MKYISKRIIYYSVLAAELLSESYDKILEKISTVFQRKDDAVLKEIFSHPTFRKLKSSDAIQMHINFVHSFCTNSDEFGCGEDEMIALEIKYDAFRLLEELKQDVTRVDPINALMRLQKEKECCVPLCALLVCIQGQFNQQVASQLWKALKGGDLDAGLILLYFSREAQYESISLEIAKVQDFYVHLEISYFLEKFYGFEKRDKMLQNKTEEV